MPYRIVFLGTSAGMPTLNRNLPGILLEWDSDLILFDCGEGIQLRFMEYGIGAGRPLRIFVSHMHGDHVLGLPGLLQTFSLLDRKTPVEVYGPSKLEEYIHCIRSTIGLNPTYDLKIFRVDDGRCYDFESYRILCRRVQHGSESYGYRFEEKDRPGVFYTDKAIALGIPRGPLWKRLQLGESIKLDDGRIIEPKDVLGPPRRGFKLAYTGDTIPCRAVEELAEGADILIHEATFTEDLAGKATVEGHTTAAQAAYIASRSSVKLLVLTHISARYVTVDALVDEAKRIYSNVVVAEDGLTIELRRMGEEYEYRVVPRI
ncbi:MAG: ribonuclease Z [Candidatus Bathyarchaeota archaeon]|nr:ribonuclease Z [Candidatus Bathyarchaeota archaeon]